MKVDEHVKLWAEQVKRAVAEWSGAPDPLDMKRIARAEEDSVLLDWCEAIAAEHPELQKDGLVPMTRAAIRAAIEAGGK